MNRIRIHCVICRSFFFRIRVDRGGGYTFLHIRSTSVLRLGKVFHSSEPKQAILLPEPSSVPKKNALGLS